MYIPVLVGLNLLFQGMIREMICGALASAGLNLNKQVDSISFLPLQINRLITIKYQSGPFVNISGSFSTPFQAIFNNAPSNILKG